MPVCICNQQRSRAAARAVAICTRSGKEAEPGLWCQVGAKAGNSRRNHEDLRSRQILVNMFGWVVLGVRGWVLIGTGSQEVTGSIPVRSTNIINNVQSKTIRKLILGWHRDSTRQKFAPCKWLYSS